MDQQATGTPVAQSAQGSSPEHAHNHRNVWIYTGYAMSFVALLAVLAFLFSNVITK